MRDEPAFNPITLGGGSGPSSSPPPRSSMALAIAGVVGALIAIVAFRAVSAPDPSPVTDPVIPESEEAAPDIELPQSGLAETLLGFDGSVELIVFIPSPVQGDAAIVERWTWSAAEAPQRVPILHELLNASFDASGRWVAGLEATGQGDHRLLVGASFELTEVAVGTPTFAWHSENAEEFAFLHRAADGSTIVEVGGFLPGGFFFKPLSGLDLDPGGLVLSRFDEAGMTIEVWSDTGDPQLVYLGRDGARTEEPIDLRPSVTLPDLPISDGRVLATDGRFAIVSGRTGSDHVDLLVDLVSGESAVLGIPGTVTAARFDD